MSCREILKICGDDTPTSEPEDGYCSVCGGDLLIGGVEMKKLFTLSTFNLNHEFYDSTGKHVCNYCSVFFSRKNWESYCERNGHDPYFPEVEGKGRALANWVFFSHAFYNGKHEIVKDRKRWRDLLSSPPIPPFCFCISTLCKKHLIFKTPIEYSVKRFQIRFEDVIVTINQVEFVKCLNAFENLYSMGLSKASIRTGEYNTSALMKVDFSKFTENEDVVMGFRETSPDLVGVCEFVSMKNEK